MNAPYPPLDPIFVIVMLDRVHTIVLYWVRVKIARCYSIENGTTPEGLLRVIADYLPLFHLFIQLHLTSPSIE